MAGTRVCLREACNLVEKTDIYLADATASCPLMGKRRPKKAGGSTQSHPPVSGRAQTRMQRQAVSKSRTGARGGWWLSLPWVPASHRPLPPLGDHARPSLQTWDRACLCTLKNFPFHRRLLQQIYG
ncbi:uncharacterized protein WM277_026119 [Molossus nigricans]